MRGAASFLFASGAPLAVACGVALAAEPGAKSLLDPGYVVEMQFGGGFQPTYPGARFYRPVPIPGLSVRRVDEPARFSAPDDGFGAPILDDSGFRLGPVGNFAIPKWSTHEELRGLHKFRTVVEAGAFAEYFPADTLRFRAEVRQGFYGHHGIVARFGADLVRAEGPFAFSIGPRVDFGDQRFARATYGVTRAEALANGRVAPFRPAAGITSAGFLSTARVDLPYAWSATAYGGLQRLTGSAAASPIPTLLGSRSQFSIGLIVAKSVVVGPF